MCHRGLLINLKVDVEEVAKINLVMDNIGEAEVEEEEAAEEAKEVCKNIDQEVKLQLVEVEEDEEDEEVNKKEVKEML